VTTDAVAAVDCGTNSTRLLVAGPGGETIERLMRITRLGQGTDRDRSLAPEAIQRTLAVLQEYRGVMDRHQVRRVRMTATSAGRDATNREDFFSAAAVAIGVRPELLDGDEEGRLSFLGATADLDATAESPVLIADIGGGSTELAVGDPGEAPTAVISLDMGCVRITERFLTDDPPSRDQMDQARAFIEGQLQTAERLSRLFSQSKTLIGLAGTVAALAAIEQGLDHYDRDRVHHYLLGRQPVDAILDQLAGIPAIQRRHRPGVEAQRADVIVGGALVLSGLLHHFGFESCLTSEADILDGLAMSLRS
jgi:exopolyphosphatase/guanosine-5'-triphosphate,3'-diphosphate pyrophosphatase